jgi:hypothetical protein
MEQRYGHVVNFSLSNGNVRQLDRVLDIWLSMKRQVSSYLDEPNEKELELMDWVSEFRIYVNQAESFQS